MDYDMEVHVPQRTEAMQAFADQGNVEMFDAALSRIKILMKDHEDFLKGLKDDQGKRERLQKELLMDAQKQVKEAMSRENLVDGFNLIPQVLTMLEQGYQAIEMGYMNDVLKTFVTYEAEDDGGESE